MYEFGDILPLITFIKFDPSRKLRKIKFWNIVLQVDKKNLQAEILAKNTLKCQILAEDTNFKKRFNLVKKVIVGNNSCKYAKNRWRVKINLEFSRFGPSQTF